MIPEVQFSREARWTALPSRNPEFPPLQVGHSGPTRSAFRPLQAGHSGPTCSAFRPLQV